MRLGTETGSLNNHILSRAVIGQPEPVVGMGATILCWTDRQPASVTKIETVRGKVIVTVQEDKATRLDRNGMCEDQHYKYEANPAGATYQFRREENGRWVEVSFNQTTKRWSKVQGHGLRIGERDKYHDFSF